jgi:hypothetical protein
MAIRQVSAAVERIKRNDAFEIAVEWDGLKDNDVEEMMDCLLINPNCVERLWLAHNDLTDKTGVQVAKFVAASTSIEYLSVSNNFMGEKTYLAMARALHTNTSLRYLYLYNNQPVSTLNMDSAFVHALRINTNRPRLSTWWLYKRVDDSVDFDRIDAIARELGHLTLQELICGRYLGREISTTTRTLE